MKVFMLIAGAYLPVVFTMLLTEPTMFRHPVIWILAMAALGYCWTGLAMYVGSKESL